MHKSFNSTLNLDQFIVSAIKFGEKNLYKLLDMLEKFGC